MTGLMASEIIVGEELFLTFITSKLPDSCVCLIKQKHSKQLNLKRIILASIRLRVASILWKASYLPLSYKITLQLLCKNTLHRPYS